MFYVYAAIRVNVTLYGGVRYVAVSRRYDTCFSVKACDGLCQLLKSTGSGWNTKRVSIDRVDLCKTHCKQVPDFFPHFLPSGQYALCFGHCFLGPLPLRSHHGQVTLRGTCFRESLVVRLYSEISRIHLSIEAQCGTPVYLGWLPQGRLKITGTCIQILLNNHVLFHTSILNCSTQTQPHCT